ncbi:hypothetical protein D917_03170 [Trichinella nativa]|uniref:SMP-LTD domain-containing protein n=1 Tax=Trichinella nativa TaxID=6335 RepID=A0A1Y3ED38_9BILA|nr:hypothetical protein D917_03170 [Trichinella nativa]
MDDGKVAYFVLIEITQIYNFENNVGIFFFGQLSFVGELNVMLYSLYPKIKTDRQKMIFSRRRMSQEMVRLVQSCSRNSLDTGEESDIESGGESSPLGWKHSSEVGRRVGHSPQQHTVRLRALNKANLENNFARENPTTSSTTNNMEIFNNYLPSDGGETVEIRKPTNSNNMDNGGHWKKSRMNFIDIPTYSVQEGCIYLGSLRQLKTSYEPSLYHKKQTTLVSVMVKNSGMMHVCTVANDSMQGEANLNKSDGVELNSERIYNLKGADVFLLPEQLARRRWWSKNKDFQCAIGEESNDDEVLYFFAKNNREKEQWFYCLKKVAGTFSKTVDRNCHSDSECISSGSDHCYANLNNHFSHAMQQTYEKIFFSLSTEQTIVEAIMGEIQKKLLVMSISPIFDTIKLISFNLGKTSPVIHSVDDPPIRDFWGLWFDFEIEYSGQISIVIETKLNVSKNYSSSGEQVQKNAKKNYCDENIPESGDSSSEEESSRIISSGHRERIKKFLLYYVAPAGNYQHTKYNKIFDKLAKIAGQPITLAIEVTHLKGRLVVNLPSPPTDRIWYAFRNEPEITFQISPKFGQHSVNLNPLTDIIKNRLKKMINKKLVIPNMDNIIIPYCSASSMTEKI